MAGPFVAVIFCEAEGKGWTETYYPVGTTHSSCMSAAQAIQAARAGLSPPSVSFLNIRVSDLTIRGDAFDQPPGTPAGTSTLLVTADPDFALLVRETDAGFLRRSLRYVRGIPSGVLTFTPLKFDASGAPAWQANLTTWKNNLVINSQMVQRHAGTPPTFTSNAIATVQEERATIRRAGRPFDLPLGRRVRA